VKCRLNSLCPWRSRIIAGSGGEVEGRGAAGGREVGARIQAAGRTGKADRGKAGAVAVAAVYS